MLPFALPAETLGAWVRGPRHVARILACGRCLLAGSDLGALLQRCGRVAVRDGCRAVAVEGHHLIARRTLRIVTGTPDLPGLDQLRLLLPELEVRGSRLAVPIGLGPPEEALAACLSARVPVVASWVEYRR